MTDWLVNEIIGRVLEYGGIIGLGFTIWDIFAGPPGIDPAIWGGTAATMALRVALNFEGHSITLKGLSLRIFIWAWLMSIGIAAYTIFAGFNRVHPALFAIAMLVIVAGYRAVVPYKKKGKS